MSKRSFYHETWADEVRLNRTLSTINFDKKWVMPRTTRGGGLVLFWKIFVKLDVVDSHRYHIDVIINRNSEDEWRGLQDFMVNKKQQNDTNLGPN